MISISGRFQLREFVIYVTAALVIAILDCRKYGDGHSEKCRFCSNHVCEKLCVWAHHNFYVPISIKTLEHSQKVITCQFVLSCATNVKTKNLKMKFALVFAAILAVALALPVDPKDATVLKYENDNIGIGGYNWA